MTPEKLVYEYDTAKPKGNSGEEADSFPSSTDIKHAVQEIKNSKSPGTYGLQAEILKYSTE